MNDFATIDRWIGKLRSNREAMRELAPAVADELRAQLTRTLSAGQAPDGSPWAERKEGGRAYQHAASRLEVRSSGTQVIATIEGPEVYGHRGVRGVRRRMLPTALSGSLAAAIRRRAVETLKKRFG